ncbi:MAG: N-6 DNA methylase [bacterium]|nr:N-6 DNA methylase [bacterium]
MHLDLSDPQLGEAGAEILARYNRDEHEHNTGVAIRDFITATGLAQPGEIQMEAASGNKGRVDLSIDSHRLYIEVKTRVGTASGGVEPNPENLEQIDGYLASSADPATIGVLTDGKHWLIRTCGDEPNTVRGPPFRHTFNTAEEWLGLFEWLRDEVFAQREKTSATPERVGKGFAPGTVDYESAVSAIRSLYQENRAAETVKIKRLLWESLLSVALGEIDGVDLDDLFVRHTYLVTVIGMITQAAFGINIETLAANDPDDLLRGDTFRDTTGLVDIVESDFFAWLVEVDGQETIRRIARHVGSFKWGETQADLASVLYQTVIPQSERQKLGEYYTPPWLAEAIVESAVAEPLSDRVLDPACGSGSFLVAAIRRAVEAAKQEDLSDTETLARLQEQVCGIDVHPVAVHLARASWVMAARDVISGAGGSITDVAVPVYLGDSLQLLHDTQSFLTVEDIVVPAKEDPKGRSLTFPLSLVNRPQVFGPLMGRIAADIAGGDGPGRALEEFAEHLDTHEAEVMTTTAAKLADLHADEMNHIWAYYTRNLVRPIVIAEEKVDAIVGNPPWLTYNKTKRDLRTALDDLGKKRYAIKPPARFVTHFDIAGLFVSRCADLYLRPPDGERIGGRLSMVLPHSALMAGQYEKWRTGQWGTVFADLSADTPWDLEKLEPNDFFPIPASVVHLCRALPNEAVALPPQVQEWSGPVDTPTKTTALLPTADGLLSPYGAAARQGATIVPRNLFFVTEVSPSTTVTRSGIAHTQPRRSKLEKLPWRSLHLHELKTPGTVEESHLFDVHLGETLTPYVMLPPLQAVLPIDKDHPHSIAGDPHQGGEVRAGSLPRLARNRWEKTCELWDSNKGVNDNKTLLQRLDYHHELSTQLKWRQGNQADPPPQACLFELRKAHCGYSHRPGCHSRLHAILDLLRHRARGALSAGHHQQRSPSQSGRTIDAQRPIRSKTLAEAPMEAAHPQIRSRQRRPHCGL